MISELRKLIVLWLSPDKNMSDKRIVNIYRSSQKELDKKFIISMALFAVCFALNLVMTIFRAEINAELSEFWWIPLIASVIWILYQKSCSDALYDQVEYKFM